MLPWLGVTITSPDRTRRSTQPGLRCRFLNPLAGVKSCLIESSLNTVSLTVSLPANTISFLTVGAAGQELDGTPDAD